MVIRLFLFGLVTGCLLLAGIGTGNGQQPDAKNRYLPPSTFTFWRAGGVNPLILAKNQGVYTPRSPQKMNKGHSRTTAPSRLPTTVVRPADLAQLAKNAPAPVAGLFQEFTQPTDLVELNGGDNLWIIPNPVVNPGQAAAEGEVEVVLAKGAKPGTTISISANEVKKITLYEERALHQVAHFLAEEPKTEPGLPLLLKLEAAETLLQAVLRFHQGQRAPLQPDTESIKDLGGQLRDRLRTVSCQVLAALGADAKRETGWKLPLQRADHLLAVYPHDDLVGKHVRQLWVRYALEKSGQQDYLSAQAMLNRIDEHFLHSPEAEPLRRSLQERAELLVWEAAASPEEGAMRSLHEAVRLWPHLPGLREALLRRQNRYQVLYVGVPRLPQFLSPALATTEVERQALALLFESLVLATAEPSHGWKREPQLARRLPLAEPLSRTFDLVRDAYWSTGERVTAADIRHTADLLSRSEADGQANVWRELLQLPPLEADPWRIRFAWRRGCPEPLRFFSFPILPQTYQGKPLQQAADETFAKAPVGSGPFRYQGVKKEGDRTYALFVANPFFDRRQRPPPTLREIRLVELTSPENKDTPLHLLLDVPTNQLAAWREKGFGDLRSVPGNRVSILAINHRLPVLSNHHLRRMLAHGIEREKILQMCFRGGQGTIPFLGVAGAAVAVVSPPARAPLGDFHRPVNGPFPPGSWACCPPPRVPADPYDAPLARSSARRVKAELGDVVLTLKYPADEPGVTSACQHLARQIEQLAQGVQTKIQIKPFPLPTHQLRQALAQRDYELAYWHFPSTDDWHDLWPWFDPHPQAVAAHGSNFLGYDNDAKLQELSRAVLNHCHPPTVRDLLHGIHAHLYERMPFIPLWQLHIHVAVHPSLVVGDLDPRWVFRHVTRWQTR